MPKRIAEHDVEMALSPDIFLVRAGDGLRRALLWFLPAPLADQAVELVPAEEVELASREAARDAGVHAALHCRVSLLVGRQLGSEGGRRFVLTDPFEGEPLAAWVESHRVSTAEAAFSASALLHLLSLGVHRPALRLFSPDGVLVSRSGELAILALRSATLERDVPQTHIALEVLRLMIRAVSPDEAGRAELESLVTRSAALDRASLEPLIRRVSQISESTMAPVNARELRMQQLRAPKFAERMTQGFGRATRKAVEELHAKGVSAWREEDGQWREFPPPKKA